MTAPDPQRRLARTSALVGVGTLASRVTGFLRVAALAALAFGPVTDVYNIANSTPNIIYELLLGGILTATLVPLFVESHEAGDDRATHAINTVAIVVLLVGTVAGVVGAPWIVRAYGSSSGHPARVALATDLLRWFMPQMFFYGVTALATAMLNARRRFAAAAFAPVLNNVVVIAMLFAVGRVASAPPTVRTVLEDPVLFWLLGLGTTAGVVAMALVLLPAVRRAGATFHWHWAPRHPAVRKLARLSGWTMGYVAANQIAFFVVLVLAYQRTGDFSVYIAAFTFFQLPHGLLAVSVMTALGPEIASRHQAHDIAGLRTHFTAGLRILVIVMIPAAVALAVMARPLINALLNHGDFNASAIAPTANTLRAFAVGLVAFSVYLYVVRTFSSMQDTRTPFVVNVVENGVNIATAFALYEWRGVEGLAWSWSVAYTVGAIVALVALRRRLERLDGRALTRTAINVLAAVLPAGVAGVWLTDVIGGTAPGQSMVTLVVVSLVFCAIFVGVLQLLGVALLRTIRGILRRDTDDLSVLDA